MALDGYFTTLNKECINLHNRAIISVGATLASVNQMYKHDIFS